MLSDILLIRHGEAYNNISVDELHEIKDLANPPLTPLGQRQARELEPVLRYFAPEAVVVSPFHRTIQTIQPYVASSGVPVSVDRRMGERIFAAAFATFEGISPDDYQSYGPSLIPDDLCRQRSSFPDYPETRESVRERVSSLFREWDAKPIQRLAFVGHGASLAALLNFLIPEYPNNTGHGNCGYSHLVQAPVGWKAESLNRQDHLTQTNGQLVN